MSRSASNPTTPPIPSSSSPSRHHPSSYPRPTRPSVRDSPISPPVPLAPYRPPPPSRLPPPRLPARPPIEPPPPGWTSSAHIVPAAYPRRYAECFGAYDRSSRPFSAGRVPSEESREERLARNEGEARETVRRRYDTPEWTEGVGGEGLYIAAERWRREVIPGGEREGDEEGVTLVVTHANGFTKESWHPTLRRLLEAGSIPQGELSFGTPSLSERHKPGHPSGPASRMRIDEIWLLDDVHHAASVDVNAGRLGAVHGWSDGGRDVINFIEHVLPHTETAVEGGILPWLPAPPQASAASRRQGTVGASSGAGGARRGQRQSKVVGVGHSFGGNALVQAAAERPDLFHALFLVEPMCPAHHVPRSSINPVLHPLARTWPLVVGASKRRTTWPSLAAVSALRTTPFFAKWHSEVWDLYLSHGLVAVDSAVSDSAGASAGAVTLATPNWAEACVFAEPTGLGEGWDALPRVSVPVGFLMGGDPALMFGAEMVREMVWRAELSANEIVQDGGHLLVQEKPDEVADALYRFLSSIGLGLQKGGQEGTSAQSGSSRSAKL